MNLRELLGRNPQEARKAVEALLDGPLTFAPIKTPEGHRYRVEGKMAVGAMFTTEGVPNGSRNVAAL